MKDGEYASDWSKYYDLFYEWKDYKAEAKILISFIKDNKKNKGKEVLEVGCGTGLYYPHFKNFNYTGLDLSKGMLKVAKEKYPKVNWIQADMRNFKLKKKFDVIICLFSSIAYVNSYRELKSTIQCFKDHLNEGGIIIFEGWFSGKKFKKGKIHNLVIKKKGMELVRMNYSDVSGNHSILNFHFLIAEEGKGIKHFTEQHKLFMFDPREVIKIMKSLDLKVTYDKTGLMGANRGLYIGVEK